MNVAKALIFLAFLTFTALVQAQESKPVNPIANYSQEQLEREVLAVDNAMFESAFGGCDAELLKKGEYELDDTGKYMHLWRLNDGQWELARAISYDHQPPENMTP